MYGTLKRFAVSMSYTVMLTALLSTFRRSLMHRKEDGLGMSDEDCCKVAVCDRGQVFLFDVRQLQCESDMLVVGLAYIKRCPWLEADLRLLKGIRMGAVNI